MHSTGIRHRRGREAALDEERLGGDATRATASDPAAMQPSTSSASAAQRPAGARLDAPMASATFST